MPVKVLILDNRCLGMVHQWQKLFYDKRYSQTLLEPYLLYTSSCV